MRPPRCAHPRRIFGKRRSGSRPKYALFQGVWNGRGNGLPLQQVPLLQALQKGVFGMA